VFEDYDRRVAADRRLAAGPSGRGSSWVVREPLRLPASRGGWPSPESPVIEPGTTLRFESVWHATDDPAVPNCCCREQAWDVRSGILFTVLDGPQAGATLVVHVDRRRGSMEQTTPSPSCFDSVAPQAPR
jgi:hypothetical protein